METEKTQPKYILDRDQVELMQKVFTSAKNISKADIIPLPSLEQYHADLQDLFNCEKNGMSQDEIGKLIVEKTLVSLNVMQFHKGETMDNATLYRTRVIGQHEDITKARTFSYPPALYSLENQRANQAGRPVFYCSINKITGLIETKLDGDCIRYLSVWKVNCKRDFLMSAILQTDLPKGNLVYGIAQKYNEFLANQVQQKDRLQHMQMLYNFMAFVFCQEAPPYYITSWIGDYLMHKNFIDILLYPSTATFLNSANFALRPAFVDENLKLERVYKISTGLTDADKVGITLIETGDSDGQNVVWRDKTDEDEEFFETP